MFIGWASSTLDAITWSERNFKMKYAAICLLVLSAPSVFAVKGVSRRIEGAVNTIGHGSEAILHTGDEATHSAYTGVDVSDGSEFAEKNTLGDVDRDSKKTFHYTVAKTARESGMVGDDSLKVITGVVTHVNRNTHMISVKTATGTIESFHFNGKASADSAPMATAQVAIYYTEKAGRKMVRFIED
jgi:hypothetical protein